jgi:N-acyl-D-amino-acid deacylase
LALPWVSSGADAESSAPEGVFLLSSTHRAHGNFARIFAKYVREEHVLSVEEAVRRLTTLPANVLSLTDRGRLKVSAFADIVIFDPKTFQDHSTYYIKPNYDRTVASRPNSFVIVKSIDCSKSL